MTNNTLLSGYDLHGLKLNNRIVMAPLTRRRATKHYVPTPLMAEYYAQRASAGLIIAEATQISADAVGYPDTPGIHNQKQLRAWQKVTEAVHKQGGHIFLQLWHVGRHSHPDLQPGRRLPAAPSAIAFNGNINTGIIHKQAPVPKAMSKTRIAQVVSAFRKAVKNAKEAGFDGVEIHGANGYLIDQFLLDSTNLRTDAYGGSIENRSRFLFEILDAVSDVWSEKRIGLRLSPSGTYHGMLDSNPQEHFSWLINQLNQYTLAYLHLVEPVFEAVDHLDHYVVPVVPFFRKLYKGILMGNGNYTPETASRALIKGEADLISFGKLYISNPDLVERIRIHAALNQWDASGFYGGGEKGYTDYPSL